MSDASADRNVHRLASRMRAWVGAVSAALALTVVMASAAHAAAGPSVISGYTIAKFAQSPTGTGNCDDLAFLGGHLFLGCQNTTLSNGGGGNSTLVEYSLTGSVVQTWSIKDKIDGLNADPLKHDLIVTLDEDANSHMATVTPSAPSGQQVTYYTYSPDPRGASTPTALHTGGGTDQVSVDSAGNVFVTGSHAGTTTGTAVFKAVLHPPSSPSGTGTTTLSPTFLDDSTAANGNTGSGTVKLALGDVDSGTIVPKSSPRFGGSYVITDQTALELVFANDIFKGTGVTVLKTPFGLDDILWTSSPGGTLYVVDKGPTENLPKFPPGVIYKVTGPFTTNMVLASNDGVPDQVVTVDLTTGKLTPFIHGLQTSKGLVYLNSDGSHTRLTLNGAPASATITPTGESSGSSLSTGAIVGIIVGALVLLAAVGFALTRRRPAAG